MEEGLTYFLVRKERFELSRVTPYASETYVSASCTTSAFWTFLSIAYPYYSVKYKRLPLGYFTVIILLPIDLKKEIKCF